MAWGSAAKGEMATCQLQAKAGLVNAQKAESKTPKIVRRPTKESAGNFNGEIGGARTLAEFMEQMLKVPRHLEQVAETPGAMRRSVEKPKEAHITEAWKHGRGFGRRTKTEGGSTPDEIFARRLEVVGATVSGVCFEGKLIKPLPEEAADANDGDFTVKDGSNPGLKRMKANRASGPADCVIEHFMILWGGQKEELLKHTNKAKGNGMQDLREVFRVRRALGLRKAEYPKGGLGNSGAIITTSTLVRLTLKILAAGLGAVVEEHGPYTLAHFRLRRGRPTASALILHNRTWEDLQKHSGDERFRRLMVSMAGLKKAYPSLQQKPCETVFQKLGLRGGHL